MDTYKCPNCDTSIEWTSNADLEEKGWHPLNIRGINQLVCPECSEEHRILNRTFMGIASANQEHSGPLGSHRRGD